MAIAKHRPDHAKRRSDRSRSKSRTPKNREAIALLDAWMSTPDDVGPERWAEYDKLLAEHPVAFREHR